MLNGEPRRLTSVEPTLTVLRYLRETERLVGTKEGCAEGDCGACTAVVATLEGSALRYRAVNTCIQLVGMLDGKALITVEGLKDGDKLHAVQEAMATHNASQCGFCTPGFVMSLFAAAQEGHPADRHAVDTLLAGNLCRCTGYSAIINAAKMALEQPQVNAFHARERQIIGQLRSMSRNETMSVSREGQSYLSPASLAELCGTLRRHPEATLVSGATDVGLWITKQNRRIDTIIDLGKIRELKRVSHSTKGLRLGATVTYERAQAALSELYPSMFELIRRLGSVQVRNLGTVGGNIANGSPIGDMAPALIAAHAQLRLRRWSGARDIPLEAFFLAYGKQDRRRSEFVESVFVPQPSPLSVLKVYKISKRFDQDISTVCGAFHLTFDRKRDKVVAARICFGGVAGIPARARRCEDRLIGKRWCEAAVAEAAEALRDEYEPISDWRGSADYRRTVAANLLKKCFLEISTGSSAQLSEARGALHAG